MRIEQLVVVAIDAEGKLRARLADDPTAAKAIHEGLVKTGRYPFVGSAKLFAITDAEKARGAS